VKGRDARQGAPDRELSRFSVPQDTLAYPFSNFPDFIPTSSLLRFLLLPLAVIDSELLQIRITRISASKQLPEDRAEKLKLASTFRAF